jgi:hypothetical protein
MRDYVELVMGNAQAQRVRELFSSIGNFNSGSIRSK